MLMTRLHLSKLNWNQFDLVSPSLLSHYDAAIYQLHAAEHQAMVDGGFW